MIETVARLSTTKLAAPIAASDWNGAVEFAKQIAVECTDDVAVENWVVEQFGGVWGRQGEEKVRALFAEARAAVPKADTSFILPELQPEADQEKKVASQMETSKAELKPSMANPMPRVVSIGIGMGPLIGIQKGPL